MSEKEAKAKRRAEDFVRDIERSKAQLARPAGNNSNDTEDDKFFHMLAHVDKAVVDKIKKGDVDIDLTKLLVKQKKTDDHRLEMINKEVYSFLIPSNEKDLPVITSFKKWEGSFQGFFQYLHTDTSGLSPRIISVCRYYINWSLLFCLGKCVQL